MSSTDPLELISEEPRSADPAAMGRIRLWKPALLAAVGAALVSWIVGELGSRRLTPRFEDVPARFQTPREVFVPYMKKLVRQGHMRKAEVSYGVLGAALGIGLGAVGAYVRRENGPQRSRWLGNAMRAGTAGLLIGGLGVTATAWVLVPRYFEALDQATEVDEMNDMIYALTVHVSVFAAIGLAGGLSLGLAIGEWPRTAVAGLLGGVCAALCYEITGALAFPTHQTGLPVADVPALRALAHLLTALAIAGFVTLAAVREKSKPRSTPRVS